MKRTAYFLLVIFLTVCPFSGFAQAGLERANKQYESFAYIDAIKTYERLAEKGYKSADMFQKLGNAYYFNSDLAQAAKWYDALFAMKTKPEPEYYYRYAQSLKAVGQYDKANQMLEAFAQNSTNDIRAQLYRTQKDYIAEINANSGRYTISDAGVNSQYSDYGSAVVGNKLIFTSARDTAGIFVRKHKWTNQSFTNMYQAEINGDSLGKPEKFAKDINLKFHESTPVFTSDGKTMYFTRNNFNDGKKGKSKSKITLLKIYRTTFDENSKKWSDAVELPFNSDNHNTAHPALSPDGKTLYFASDMKGTKGQSDIFKVSVLENNKSGTPENVALINTEGRESFP
ncbi:MAG TPA: flagellar motor protein MotB, partial [Flavobacterium sp.]|nr:flagellar motor protein MotB [Flavobacterium sp.]